METNKLAADFLNPMCCKLGSVRVELIIVLNIRQMLN